MLERKAYQDLLDWKKTGGKSALLIEGARRVGKSTLVDDFGKREYKSCLLLDFSTVPNDIKRLFDEFGDNVDSFLTYLAAYTNVPFHLRDTLIIFDEVQDFPRARAFLKHLVADGRYDYIATGSLISIRRNVENILIPSEEEPLALNPMDFEEFLTALGEDQLVDILRSTASNPQALPDAIHRKAMRLFREYMLVGGMPQVVDNYREHRDFMAADKIKRRILNLYRNDAARYAKGYEDKVIEIFDNIPSELSRHEKKFRLSSLGQNARRRDHEEALFWLENAKIVNRCYNNTDPNVGLGMNRDKPSFKCYMADTGLLFTHAFSDRKFTPNEMHREILSGNIGLNEGMLAENVVAQALIASGHKLYFYSLYDKENADRRMEIDFLITGNAAKTGICPIEVKSSGKYKTVSLDKFVNKYGMRVGNQYILHIRNVKVEGSRIFLPLYMAQYL